MHLTGNRWSRNSRCSIASIICVAIVIRAATMHSKVLKAVPSQVQMLVLKQELSKQAMLMMYQM